MTPPNRPTRGRRRWLAAAAAAALGSALLPVSTAGAAIDTSEACPAAIPPVDFTDLASNPAADAVACITAYGIAQGVTETSYGPAIPITRAQVATFLVRILEGTDGVVLPDPVYDAFDDDDGYVPHEGNINIAAALGIIDGYGDGTFRPGDLVTRAQMAKLVVNALEEAGATIPAVTDDAFDDDDESVHEPSIDALAALDVVDGIGPGTYDPSGTVRRDTMALYLSRSVQVLVGAALWEPYTAPVAAPVALAAELTGGDDFTFGDDLGDTLTIAYDSPVVVDGATATVTIDPDGARVRAAASFVCGPQLPCVADGNLVTFTVGDAAAVTGDVLLDEGAAVTAAAGVTGADGGLAATGYPVALLVNVIRVVGAATTDLTATFDVEFASNEAVAGTTVAFSVAATCTDTDADGIGDDPPFTMTADVAGTPTPVALTCGEGVVTGTYPQGSTDLLADVSVFFPTEVTFDAGGSYPIAFVLLDADEVAMAATTFEAVVAPAGP